MTNRRGDLPLAPKKTCFVICPIGDEGSPERKWSDDLLECIISPIVEKMGFQTPIRADRINESGIITRQIVDLLIESDLVIADLSFRNPNVCYELAVRHIVKKPFIHMIRNGHKIPFDTSSNRAISVDIDIRSANRAMEELESHISSIERRDNEMDNPIGTALTLRDLKGSGDPSQMMSANLMEAIQNIASEVKALRELKSNPYSYGGGAGNLIAANAFPGSVSAPNLSDFLSSHYGVEGISSSSKICTPPTLLTVRQHDLLAQYREVTCKIRDQMAQTSNPEEIVLNLKGQARIMTLLIETGLSQNQIFQFASGN